MFSIASKVCILSFEVGIDAIDMDLIGIDLSRTDVKALD
jgi:hypothetical protein